MFASIDLQNPKPSSSCGRVPDRIRFDLLWSEIEENLRMPDLQSGNLEGGGGGCDTPHCSALTGAQQGQSLVITCPDWSSPGEQRRGWGVGRVRKRTTETQWGRFKFLWGMGSQGGLVSLTLSLCCHHTWCVCFVYMSEEKKQWNVGPHILMLFFKELKEGSWCWIRGSGTELTLICISRAVR